MPFQPQNRKRKVQTAPAVPRFGAFPIKKPRPNALGLTPRGEAEPQEPSSPSSSISDEESSLLLAENVPLENELLIRSLTTPRAIDEFVEERKRNFATRERIEQKKEEKKREAEERREYLTLANGRLNGYLKGNELVTEKVEDSDGPPEVISAKMPEKTMCLSYLKNGRCSHGNNCRFLHAEARNKSKGIYHLMIEKQADDEDLLALRVIKYLGRAGSLRGE
ncbi:hypothetical protein K470DRAFT_271811 [Piedraia hortae CBS 480.64]|uniref:C3H1-type domain-containing protein n=1 Tax=Piedraia hortae CBS 480.64 TaxID=1314780 RepID=A0A6A7BWJ4_9PEZI|nr:hypothetical protein K470DRAFT_271811 [Piedraia hortae CBS 480.64]